MDRHRVRLDMLTKTQPNTNNLPRLPSPAFGTGSRRRESCRPRDAKTGGSKRCHPSDSGSLRRAPGRSVSVVEGVRPATDELVDATAVVADRVRHRERAGGVELR